MFGAYEKVIETFKDKNAYLILIDGDAGSGKTTFAEILKDNLDVTLIHMDDFYLPIKKRKADWFETPAGNMDFERLKTEIINPFKNKEDLIINRFNPRLQELGMPENLKWTPRLIIEGSYSMHPGLGIDKAYKIFMKCDDKAQAQRLVQREKDNYVNFQKTWIVKERKYHEAFRIEEKADLIIDTSDLF